METEPISARTTLSDLTRVSEIMDMEALPPSLIISGRSVQVELAVEDEEHKHSPL